jgi:transcriptional regulator
MYNYPHYKEHDLQKIIAFMKENPFAMIIGAGSNGRSEVTQIPLLIEEKNGKICLFGHMAKKSDHHSALIEKPDALVIFTGPQVYVSGSWYTGNPRQGSTWNYISIHARGKVKWMSEAELIDFMQRLSLYFEKGNQSSSTVYNNLPDDYKLKMIKAIDGFCIEVAEMDNVHKLSQNRDEKSYDNIIKELKKHDGDGKEIANLMEAGKNKVFPA